MRAVLTGGCCHRRGRNRWSACRFGARRPPRFADGRNVEPLRFEHASGSSQVLLALAETAAACQHMQHHLVHARIEGRELEPLLEICERFVVAEARDQMLEQRGPAGAQPPPLRDQPGIEGRAAVDLQALQEIAPKQVGERAQPFRRERVEPVLDRARNFRRIDETVREVEPDHVAIGIDTAAAGRVHDPPQLAQRPAQLAARIVGHVPQELA
jgi:hypothetical protein